MNDFQEKLQSFFSDFGKGKTMVLSTSADGKPFIETFDFLKSEYSFKEFKGI